MSPPKEGRPTGTREWPELWIALAEASAGLVIGLVGSILTNSPIYGLALGILVVAASASLVGMHRTSQRLKDLEEAHGGRIGAMDARLDGRIGALDARLGDLVREIARSEERQAQPSRLMRIGQLHFGPNEIPDVWGQLLWTFRDSYHATNHIRSFGAKAAPGTSHFYLEGFARTAHELQRFRIEHHGVKVRKVMIVNDACELAELASVRSGSWRGVLCEQLDSRMDVRYVFWRDVLDRQQLRSALERLQTEDFGVFDSRTVLLWHLDPNTRHVVECTVLDGEDEAAPYAAFYERLSECAHRLRPVRFKPQPADGLRAAIRDWGSYGGDYAAYDYALGANGWLDPAVIGENARYYSASHNERIVGFSALVPDAGDTRSAEFFVAVHPDHVGSGFGPALALATLQHGFAHLELGRIHLKVRNWNRRAADLYTRLGFRLTATKTEWVHDRDEVFELMDMDLAAWDSRRAQELAPAGG